IATIDNIVNSANAGAARDANPVSGQGALNLISSFGNTNVSASFQFNNNGGNQGTPGFNDTYAGPTTIYAGNVGYRISTINGQKNNDQMNPYNVLNLGGTLAWISENNFFDPGPFRTVATQINLVADTSSHMVGAGYGGAFPLGPSGTYYLNSSLSNAIT